MKKNNHKKLIIASAAVIIAAGAGAAVYAASNASADSDTETGYREYSVSKGVYQKSDTGIGSHLCTSEDAKRCNPEDIPDVR